MTSHQWLTTLKRRTLFMLAAPGLIAGAFAQSASPADSSENPIVLSEFRVNTTNDVGYRASNSVSGSRFNTPIKDLPFALQAFTNEFIADIHPTSFYDIALYSPGVTFGGADFNDGNFQVSIRGFNVNFSLRDGMRGPPIIDVANIERAEVVKGPSSFLYGQLAPGGMLNVITKAPKEKFEASVTAGYGSYGEYNGMIDVTGPAPYIKGLTYRAVYSYTQDMHFWKPYDSKQTDFAPQIQWKPSDRLTLRFQLENFHKNESPQLFQTPQYSGPSFPDLIASSVAPLVPGFILPPGVPTSVLYRNSNDLNLSGVTVFGLPQNFNQMAYADYRHSHDLSYTATVDVKGDDHWDFRMLYGHDKSSIDMTFSGRPVSNPNINGYTAAYNAAIAAGKTPAQAAADPTVFANSGFAQPRRQRWQTYDKLSDDFEFQAFAKYNFSGVSLKVLAGAQYNPYSFRVKNAQAPDAVVAGTTTPLYNPSGPFPPWDLRDPSTWNRSLPGVANRANNSVSTGGTNIGLQQVTNNITRNRDEAIYIGATWGFFHDDLLVLTGVRRTYTSIQNENDLDASLPLTPPAYVRTMGREFTADKNTPQVGALYKVRKDLSVFASYSKSFVAQTGTLSAIDKSDPNNWVSVPGSAVPPTEGKGYDFGVKADFFNGRLSGTISYFDVQNTNIVTSVPITGPVLGQPQIFFPSFLSGLQESKGVEVDLVYSPIDNWQIYGSASIENARTITVIDEATDAKYLAINTVAGYLALPSGEQGPWRNVWFTKNAPLQMSAPHSYNLWTKYTIKRGPLKGLFVGGGANFMRNQQVFQQTAPQNRQTYTLLNALFGYSTKIADYPVTATLNGKNLTNEIYLPSQNTQSRPREWILSITTKL